MTENRDEKKRKLQQELAKIEKEEANESISTRCKELGLDKQYEKYFTMTKADSLAELKLQEQHVRNLTVVIEHLHCNGKTLACKHDDGVICNSCHPFDSY